MSHFAELTVPGASRWAPDQKIRAVARFDGKHEKNPRIVFFVERQVYAYEEEVSREGFRHGIEVPRVRSRWFHAGSLRWTDMLAAEREGASLWPKAASGKPARYGFRVMPADVRALSVRLDAWLETQVAA